MFRVKAARVCWRVRPSQTAHESFFGIAMREVERKAIEECNGGEICLYVVFTFSGKECCLDVVFTFRFRRVLFAGERCLAESDIWGFRVQFGGEC